MAKLHSEPLAWPLLILLAILQTIRVSHCSQQQTLASEAHEDQQAKTNIRGDIYFQISEPENLRYTFKARSARAFGVPFKEKMTNIALVLAEPGDACTSIINKLELRDNVAMVERGGCSFLQKCIEIERSGGVGIIVYDYDKHNDEVYIEMIDDNTSRNCSIPAVSLLGKDGHMIVQSLMALRLNRAVITIPINTSTSKVTNPPWLSW
ncbi:Protease-associated domain-containing protein 1, partial [Fragariocoptes setiger]